MGDITLTKDGRTISVPEADAATLLSSGWQQETASGQVAREEGELYKEQDPGIAASAITSGLSGLTLGGFDAYVRALGGEKDLSDVRARHPVASTIGNVVGALGPSMLVPYAGEDSILGSLGTLASKTPAGMVAGIGSKIAELGKGGTMLARAGATAGAGAFEGAAQNAGAYISDVALGDKELSADGFMAAMGKGALFGGGAGGALSLAGSGLQAARRLFPAQELTEEAASKASREAADEIGRASDDAGVLKQSMKSRLQEIREQRAAVDLDFAQRLNEIQLQKEAQIAGHEVSAAQSKAEAAAARAERAKAPRVRRAFAGEEPAAPATEAPSAPAAEAPAPSIAAPAAAVPEEAAGDATTLLERQLAATKQGLDSGLSLSDVAAQRPSMIGAADREIAKVDPEADRLVRSLGELDDSHNELQQWLGKYQGGSVAKFERSQAARDYASAMRPQEPGYYASVPAGEGSVAVPRGVQRTFRGSDVERAAAEAKINAKVSPEEKVAADDAIEQMFGRRAPSGADIVGGAPPASVDDQVRAALGARVPDVNEDINQAADTIGRFEAAHADAVEALGPRAPSSAQDRAAGMRAAQKSAEDATATATARAAQGGEAGADVVALGGNPVPAAAAAGKGGLLKKGIEMAKNMGTAAEALRMLGLNVPDPKSIPVIGPLLSLYLKARMVGKAFSRYGGKVIESPETVVAAKAASARQQVYTAVDSLVDGGSKALQRAAEAAPPQAAVLGHKIFDDGTPQPKTPVPAGASEPQALFLARADEINRAVQPGALEKQLQDRLGISDPRQLQPLLEAQLRKFQFLDGKLPKPDSATTPIAGQAQPLPPQASITKFARYLHAAEDPIAVLTRAVADGYVHAEEAETLSAVYPSLVADAAKRFVERASSSDRPIPYGARLTASRLLGIPADASYAPGSGSFLQQSYKAQPPPAPPQAPQGRPTITSDVRFDQRSDPATKG